jgi:hypothetical protein
MSQQPQGRHPTSTEWGPGMAALASCRHAWGTIQTAISRLEQNPPPWTDDQVAEAIATLRAAQERVEVVGKALGQIPIPFD